MRPVTTLIKMLKALAAVRTSKFLLENVTRHFANYRDTGEYHFLGNKEISPVVRLHFTESITLLTDRFNYVGNRGIFWTHPQSSFIIRVTDDYDQCCRGNLSNDDNTCWWYFPKRILSMMENDFNEQDVRDIENENRNWKLIQTAPKNYVDWSISTARCYGAFPQVPSKQKVFAAKQFLATFYIDDAIEKLSSKREFNSAADELLKNLGLVYSDSFDQLTDMSKFKGRNNIPELYIENSIRALEIQNELIQSAKQILKPKIYDLFVRGCCDYLNGVKAEKALFQKHCPTGTNISEQEGKAARNGAFGFAWILATTMTDENTALYLNIQNPAIDLATVISFLDNDLIGYPKDKNVDFSPMSFFHSSGKSDLESAKILANRINEAKKIFVYLWEAVRPENIKHYEHLAKYVGFLIDYSFVTRLRHTNNRYGWIPQLD